MPVISIVSNPLDLDTKRELVEEMTDVAARVMKLPPETIVIVIDEKTSENIGVAGRLLADRTVVSEESS